MGMAPLLLLLGLLVPATLPCGPVSVPSGNTFCATQSCTHIYNFRPCSYWNPVSCTCAAADASCDTGYTMDADGTKCYIRRTGQTSWANAQTLCQSNDNRHVVHDLQAAGRLWTPTRTYAIVLLSV